MELRGVSHTMNECAPALARPASQANQLIRGNAPLGLAQFGEAAAVAAAVAPDSPRLGPSLGLSLGPSLRLSLSLGLNLSLRLRLSLGLTLSLSLGLACTPFDRPGLRSPSSSSVSLEAQG